MNAMEVTKVPIAMYAFSIHMATIAQQHAPMTQPAIRTAFVASKDYAYVMMDSVANNATRVFQALAKIVLLNAAGMILVVRMADVWWMATAYNANVTADTPVRIALPAHSLLQEICTICNAQTVEATPGTLC